MIFLEMAMIIVGLGAVFLSLRMSSDSNSKAGGERNRPVTDEERQQESMRMQAMLDSFTARAETICDNLEDKMSQMSNEKILGMNEYSDQVLEGIEKNHDEVVFLYDMMNEKQEELKNLVHAVDMQKAEMRDEAAIGYQRMKEQGKLLDEMKKGIEVDFLQFQSEQGKFRDEFGRLRDEFTRLEDRIAGSIKQRRMDSGEQDVDAEPVSAGQETENMDGQNGLDDFYDLIGSSEEIREELDAKAEDTAEAVFDTSVFDDEIARIEEEEERTRESEPMVSDSLTNVSENYRPLSEQEEVENHNDEILSLYKKGRSILEISKMLSLGQGEVKFVIDLYNAR